MRFRYTSALSKQHIHALYKIYNDNGFATAAKIEINLFVHIITVATCLDKITHG